jgi:Holliday junction resolvasome RuvABC endonuclease subunit
MVTRILSLAVPAEAGDATDALAVALCLACSLPAAALSALAARPGEAP